MINDIFITSLLEEANKRKIRMKERYVTAKNPKDKRFYRELYLKSLDLYSARYQTVLALGYYVVFDENNNIIGIKKF